MEPTVAVATEPTVASKETCRVAQQEILRLGGPSDAVKYLEKFLALCESRLPSETSIAKDKARKKSKKGV